MAENTDIDTTHDNDLGDEALDRSSGGKLSCACSGCACPGRVG